MTLLTYSSQYFRDKLARSSALLNCDFQIKFYTLNIDWLYSYDLIHFIIVSRTSDVFFCVFFLVVEITSGDAEHSHQRHIDQSSLRSSPDV